MKKELQEILFNRYPKIFAQKGLPMTETAMCWGIDCGDGWFRLIDDLCGHIQRLCDKEGYQIEATQVKEKYGTLRFYTNFSWKEIDEVIERAERWSSTTCEDCGQTGKGVKLRARNGWLSTLCETCYKREV